MRERKAQRIAAIFLDHIERIDDIAFRLRHLLALLVAHKGVDIDRAERHILHEMQPHHHHAGDPEEDNIKAGDKNIGRVITRQAPAFSPASRASKTATAPTKTMCRARLRRASIRPACRNVSAASAFALLVFGDENLSIRPIPRRDLMPPPKLALNAPRLDIVASTRNMYSSHCWGTNFVCPSFTALMSFAAQALGIAIPLLRKPRLDRHAGTVAMRHRVRVRFDLVQQPKLFHIGDDAFTRFETVKAAIFFRRFLVQLRMLIENIDHRQLVAACQPRNR